MPKPSQNSELETSLASGLGSNTSLQLEGQMSGMLAYRRKLRYVYDSEYEK
jgi:hypothetical protein